MKNPLKKGQMMEQINRDSEDCTDDETMVKEKERKTDGTRKRG